MDPQIITEQIASNNDYSLQLLILGSAITFKLTIKVSKHKTDVYQKTLNSLNDVEKLTQQFGKAELFLQYIRDPKNFRVDLSQKIIVIIEHNAKKREIVPITSIPLQLLSSIEKKPEQELVQQILDRCSSKKQLSGEQIMSFFQNVAICIGQSFKSKKEDSARIIAQEEKIIILEKDNNALSQRLEKVERLLEKLELKLQQNERNIIQKVEQPNETVENQEEIDNISQNWVDPECLHFNKVVVSGSTITSIDNVWIFGKQKLVGQCSYTVMFDLIGKYAVGLGVSDIQNKHKGYSSWNNNFVRYQNNGNCCIAGNEVGKRGDGFMEGETVTVAIDMSLGTIKWEVQQQVIHQVTHAMLKDTSINWVPYILLRNKDDCVEIMK